MAVAIGLVAAEGEVALRDRPVGLREGELRVLDQRGEEGPLGVASHGARRRRRPAARPVPRPNHPGRFTRAWLHAKTHGIARRSSIDRAPAVRRDGLEPSWSSPISSIGVARRKNSANPGRSIRSRQARSDASAIRSAVGPKRRQHSAACRSCSGVEASRTAFVSCSRWRRAMRRVAVAGERHLALLGDLEPAADRAGRLPEDRAVRRAAAAAERAAAAVEQRERDAAVARPHREVRLRVGTARGSPPACRRPSWSRSSRA